MAKSKKDRTTSGQTLKVCTEMEVHNPKEAFGTLKIPASGVSQLVMAEISVAMLEGVLKYGRHNYRKTKVKTSVYYDATRRHLDAFWEGEDIDKLSNLSHITKAITSLVVLRDAMLTGTAVDDRPPKLENLEAFYADLNEKCAELIKKFGHIKPKHYTQIE